VEPWKTIWFWLEQVFLVIYTFELAVKFKRWRLKFFTNDARVWNNLDFVIVLGGVVEQWMVPVIDFVSGMLTGPHNASGGETFHNIMKLLRILRLLRVLRLIRMLKSIKPLYRLTLGMLEAFQAIQWVVVLTFLMLYAGGIVFTSLVGHGDAYRMSGQHEPHEAKKTFRTVSSSMLALFELMNDDLSVVDSIESTWFGQLMFAVFMVLSNWSMLVVLTSVVSDNMISTSQRAEEEEQQRTAEMERKLSDRRLRFVFQEICMDGSGTMQENELESLLADDGLRWEICDASGLSAEEVRDFFELTCEVDERKNGAKFVNCNSFIKAISIRNRHASERSILRVTEQIAAMEERLDVLMDTAVRNQADKHRNRKHLDNL